MIEKLYSCKYCNAKFAKEKTLTVHMCEQKRRFTQKENASVAAFDRYARGQY